MGTLADFWDRIWLPSLYVLNAAERNGILLDAEVCRVGAERAATDAEKHLSRLQSWAPQVENWRSFQQVAAFLYDYKRFPIPPVCGTAKATKRNRNKRVTDEAGITWLSQNVESSQDRAGLRELLAYRKAVKYGQYLSNLPTHRDQDGRIHCVLGPDTDTGRLSARNPALQQIPKSDQYGIRRAFVARPGYRLVVADYSQLELYVLAHYCIELFGDYSLAHALETGDVHSFIAKKAWPYLAKYDGPLKGEHIPKADLKKRDDVKSVVYGMNYGKTAYNLGVGITDEAGEPIGTEAAQALMDTVFAALPGVPKFQAWVQAFARKQGYVETLLKRRRPLPEAQSDDEYEAARAGRQALNTPMQGGGADIVTMSMLKLNTEPLFELKEAGWYHEELAACGAKYLLQIHDEHIFEVPEEHADRACALIKDGMENPGLKLKVPLKVEAAVAENWADGH